MQDIIRGTILALCLGAAGARAAELTIRIEGVENKGGRLMVALYDAAGYMKKPVQHAAVEAVAGSTTLTIKDVAPGEYAFAVFHDANGNGRLDKNRMGIPVEAYAFSNDAQGFMGPPSFDDARFTLPADGATVGAGLR